MTLPPLAGATLVSDFDDPDWTMVNDSGELAVTQDAPVDTPRALRVFPKPKHNAAALLKQYPEPRNWTGYGALTLWVRPDRPLPVRAFLLRLRNSHRYGPAFKLVSHEPTYTLAGGQWTQLRYELGDVPRDVVQILRVYYHRGELCSGPFDLDEVLLHKSTAAAGAAELDKAAGAEDKPIPD